jgi:hypothetical protein
MLLNNAMRRKATDIGHILRRNYFLYIVFEGHMTEAKRIGRKRRIQLFYDFENRRRLGAKGGSRRCGNDRLIHERKEELQAIWEQLTNNVVNVGEPL